MSKRRHNFGTKRFKEKSLFIFHARIALKSLILLFVRLIARGARIWKTHTHTHTDRQDKYCNPRACAPRVNKTSYFLPWTLVWLPLLLYSFSGASFTITYNSFSNCTLMYHGPIGAMPLLVSDFHFPMFVSHSLALALARR